MDKKYAYFPPLLNIDFQTNILSVAAVEINAFTRKKCYHKNIKRSKSPLTLSLEKKFVVVLYPFSERNILSKQPIRLGLVWPVRYSSLILTQALKSTTANNSISWIILV